MVMTITSAGGISDRWTFVLDTPLNGAAICFIFIAGFVLAVFGVKKAKITNWVMLPVLIPYLILSVFFTFINSATLF